MAVRVDLVDCSSMRRAVRNGANDTEWERARTVAQQEQCAPSDAWAKIKSRLRAELGEDVFASWFRGVELEQVDDEVVHLTVATRFLRNWLRTHYYDFVLRLARAEWPAAERVEFRVRQPHFGTEGAEASCRARGGWRCRLPAAPETPRRCRCPSHRLWRLRGLAARSETELHELRRRRLEPARSRRGARGGGSLLRRRSRCSIRCSSTAMSAWAKRICCTRSPGT